MKYKAIFLGLIFVAVAAPEALGRTVMIDRIIARVNEEIITQRQFDHQIKELRVSLAKKYSGEELQARLDAQSKDLLEHMIDQDLLVQKAGDLNMHAETDVVERLDQLRKQMGLSSIQELERVVEKQGLIWEDFQQNIRRQILTQKVIQERVGSRIMPSDTELRKFFDTHKSRYAHPAGVDLAEIQISSQKWGAAQAKSRAQAALNMIQAGAKWDDTVKKYSDGPNATSGGNVGFFPNGSLIPAISDALKNLDPGDTSSLIPIQNGYLIVKLLDERSPGAPKFGEVRSQVENDYYVSKMQPALRTYLTKLRRESYIYLAPGFVDAGALHPGRVGSAQDQTNQ